MVSKSNTMVELVKKARDGDNDAFSSLMKNVQEQAYKMAYTYVKNEDDAMDIVYESVYKAYKSIKKLQSAEFFKTWFIRIIINSSITFVNKQKKVTYLDHNEGFWNTLVTCEDENVADKLDLFNAIDVLSPEHKSIILLRFYEDKKLEEIANILMLPLSTVKTRLYKALAIMKSKLQGE